MDGIGLNPLDIALLLVMLGSAIYGLMRGFVSELLSLIGWSAGVVLALAYARTVGNNWLPFSLAPSLRTPLAGILILACCVFLAAMLGVLVRRLLAAAKISAADRALGAMFGLCRGVLIVIALVAAGAHLGLAQMPWWRAARMVPVIQSAGDVLGPWLHSLIQ